MGVVLISIYLLYAAGRDFIYKHERLKMTSGERKCWNVTILDDSIDEMEEQFYLHLDPLYSSFVKRSATLYYFVKRSATVYITDNDGGMWKLSEVGGLIVQGIPLSNIDSETECVD